MFMDVVVLAGIGTVGLMIAFLVAVWIFVKNSENNSGAGK